MAHSASSRKRIRQNAKRQLLNRRRKTAVKVAVREFSDKLAGNNAAEAAEALKVAYKKIDQMAAKGTMHRKTAARRKSLLARNLNKVAAAS